MGVIVNVAALTQEEPGAWVGLLALLALALLLITGLYLFVLPYARKDAAGEAPPERRAFSTDALCGESLVARGARGRPPRREDPLLASHVRRLVLTLPGVEENRGRVRSTYRAGARVFATHRRRRGRLLLRMTAHEQDVLTAVRPAEFESAPGRPRGLTWVVLARVDPWLLEQVLLAAWRRVAPARHAAAWNAARMPARTGTNSRRGR